MGESFAGFKPLDERVRARPAAAFDRWLLSLLHKALGDAPVRLVLWDGTEHRSPARPVATLRVRDRKTLVGMLLDPDLNVGDAYASGGSTGSTSGIFTTTASLSERTSTHSSG